jgi:hypothetical protein
LDSQLGSKFLGKTPFVYLDAFENISVERLESTVEILEF